VSHHAIPSFEEQAVFVRDMQLCLSRLSDEHGEMITLVGLYDLSREEVAEMLHCSRWWVQDHFARALDALSEVLLQARILDENRPDRRQRQVSSRKLAADVAAVGKRPCAAVEAAVSTDVKTVG
jgi:AraC-like DNA-binding protein